MFGGPLIAGADTEGRPSLAWRARHTARSTRRQAAGIGRGAGEISAHRPKTRASTVAAADPGTPAR